MQWLRMLFSQTGRGKCLCIPPILHDTKMPCQSAEGGGRHSYNNPSMAESTILPSAPGNVCGLSNTAAPSDGSITSPGGTTAPTNSKRDSKISGVENLRRSTEMQGFSTQASELLMSAWRKGTQSAYNYCWKQWHSWCDKRKIDPFCASLEHITNFLAELYEQGYEYRTINNYRSAISAFHPEIGGMKVGQTNTIKQLMTGIFNSKPPLPRYTETWDVDQVLKHLVNLEENNSLSLKVLSHKLVTLMALTSASRSSALHKLDTRSMQVSQKEVVFTITGLTKTRKVNDKPLVLTFTECENEKLNVKTCILDYLERTRLLRENDTQFLISHVKPHKAIKACTIATWLKQMLFSAGIDTSVFKAHSTRGASTSKANKFGLSIGQIMTQANWKSATTFQRFYKKTIQETSTSQEFASAILNIA